MYNSKKYLEEIMRARKTYEMEKQILHYLREGNETKMLAYNYFKYALKKNSFIIKNILHWQEDL